MAKVVQFCLYVAWCSTINGRQRDYIRLLPVALQRIAAETVKYSTVFGHGKTFFIIK